MYRRNKNINGITNIIGNNVFMNTNICNIKKTKKCLGTVQVVILILDRV